MCGGGAAADRGYFIQPTIFGDVKDDMTIAREEVCVFNLSTLYLGKGLSVHFKINFSALIKLTLDF